MCLRAHRKRRWATKLGRSRFLIVIFIYFVSTVPLLSEWKAVAKSRTCLGICNRARDPCRGRSSACAPILLEPHSSYSSPDTSHRPPSQRCHLSSQVTITGLLLSVPAVAVIVVPGTAPRIVILLIGLLQACLQPEGISQDGSIQQHRWHSRSQSAGHKQKPMSVSVLARSSYSLLSLRDIQQFLSPLWLIDRISCKARKADKTAAFPS